MVILSVDYGDARTGLAVCDKFEKLAVPVCTITEYNKDRLIDKIISKAAEYKAEMFIVGLPKNMDSSLGSRAEKCTEFAAELSEKAGIPYEMADERLTTVSAYVSLNTTNTRRDKRKNAIDQLSAVIILQDYIDAKRIREERKD